jgi:Na+-translocating ferredoxin:NAD+ oxidoreductase RnfG subunit
MKQETFIRYILRITLVLLAIAVVVAGLLALVNRVTAPVIAKAT